MTPEQIREALGLAPGASEIEVAAKLAALGLIPKAVEPVEEPKVEPVKEPVAVEEPKTPDISDHPIVKELRESLRLVTEQQEQARTNEAARERDQFLEQAVAAGRLKPADRERFAKLYDAAPDITKETVLARAANSEVPVGALGHAANPEGVVDEFEAAIPDPGKGF